MILELFFFVVQATLSTTMTPNLLQAFAILSMLCCSTTAQSYNDTKTLINDLMGTYNKKVRPVETVSEVLNVSLTFYLSCKYFTYRFSSKCLCYKAQTHIFLQRGSSKKFTFMFHYEKFYTHIFNFNNTYALTIGNSYKIAFF
jgi:hypothetical protein